MVSGVRLGQHPEGGGQHDGSGPTTSAPTYLPASLRLSPQDGHRVEGRTMVVLMAASAGPMGMLAGIPSSEVALWGQSFQMPGRVCQPQGGVGGPRP